MRTQRKRPDSRFDLAAELESRLPSSQTEDSLDTLANPWTGAQATLTTTSLGTPIELENTAIEERSESGTEPVAYNAKAADAALEQQHLTKQLRNLAQEVKRIRSQAATARQIEEAGLEPIQWTARELRLVHWVVARWQRLRSYAMAEEILKMAVNVREANVIA